MRTFAERVLAVVRAVPSGAVVSYAEVALRAGNPGAARAVGSALTSDVPWWRVVRSDGTLAKGERQARLLRAEGIAVSGARVQERRLRPPRSSPAGAPPPPS